MGFRRGYTRPAVKSGVYKSDPAGAEVTRKSLLGNSFRVEVVAWLLSHVAYKFGYLDKIPTIEEIRSKATRTHARGTPLQEPLESRGFSPEQTVVLEHIRGCNQKGSDVKLNTQTLMDPDCWPRLSLDPKLWHWKHVVSFRWQEKAHINELECRAYLAALL